MADVELGPALVERAEILSALRRAVDEVRASGEGRLLVVTGEAGAGKTTLLHELSCEVQGTGPVLRGACEPLRTPRPLGPLLDIADAIDATLPAKLARAGSPYDVARALLSELGSSRFSLLVVEDLHWADEATLDVLTLLTERVKRVRALLVATQRDEGLELADTRRLLLSRVGHRDRLTVPLLTPAGVARLAEPHRLDARHLHELTGGNPFFVTEVLAAQGASLPATVRDAVLSRVAPLSPLAQHCLKAVSVVPGQIELWLVDALTGSSAPHVEECIDAGILVAGEAGVSFRHELARLAVESTTGPVQRRELHRQALAALEAQGADEVDAARLAHHAGAAGDDAKAFAWARVAGDRAAASGAHREASEQYAQALQHAHSLPPDERADLLSRRAAECYVVGLVDDAVEAQQAALEHYRAVGDTLREGDALRTLARMLFFASRSSEAQPHLEQAVAVLETLPPGHELAMAYGAMAQRRMVVQDIDAAELWGERTIALAERLDDLEALVYGLTSLGSSRLSVGDPRAASMLGRALDLARVERLDEHAGRVFQSLVRWSLRRREVSDALAHLRPGLEYCTEHGLEMWRSYLLALESVVHLRRGALQQAADAAEHVLADPRVPPVAWCDATTTLAIVRLRRGEAGSAELLDEANARVRDSGELNLLTPITAARAEAAWLAGDAESVVALTDTVLSLAVERRAGWDAAELACWRWRAGLPAPTFAWMGDLPWRRSIDGDWAGAATAWEALDDPYELALALSDSSDPAVEAEAVTRLHALGAGPAAALISRRLREGGATVPRGPRRQTRENPAGLTGREVEVLALLAEGLRNATIAERLVLSERTVDSHVSSILRKLEVPGRAEAVEKARDLGALGEPS